MTNADGKGESGVVIPYYDPDRRTLKVYCPEFINPDTDEPISAELPVKVNYPGLRIESGNGQIGVPEKPLEFPLTVSYWEDCLSVIFTAKSPGGKVDGQTSVDTVTDANGEARVMYTFGTESKPQIIEARINPDTPQEKKVYFAAGPAEIRFVKSIDLTQLHQLPNYEVFDKEWNIRPADEKYLYRLEYLGPSDGPSSIDLQVYSINQCGEIITSMPRAVATLSQQITLQRVETTERFARYRSEPIQNTQELYISGMEARYELPPERKFLQCINGGSTLAVQPSDNIKGQAFSSGLFFIDVNGLRRTRICEYAPDPYSMEPINSISRIIKYDRMTDSSLVWAHLETPIESLDIALTKKEPGIFISGPLVIIDHLVDISGWVDRYKYTVVRSSSDTTEFMELRVVGSGDKANESKKALAFCCVNPAEDSSSKGNYKKAKEGLRAAITGLFNIGYDITGGKNIGKKNEVLLEAVAPWQLKPSLPNKYEDYDIRKYDVLYAGCHGKAYLRPGPVEEKKNEFAGLSLGIWETETKFKYDNPYGLVDPDRTGEYPQVFFGEKLKEYRETSPEVFNHDYKFVFLNACLSAENNKFDRAAPVQDPAKYEMSVGAKAMMEGFNTHAYMGWEKRTRFPGSTEFAKAFFEALSQKKNKPLKKAMVDALKVKEVIDYPYVKQMIKLLVGEYISYGETKKTRPDTKAKLTTYSIWLDKK